MNENKNDDYLLVWQQENIKFGLALRVCQHSCSKLIIIVQKEQAVNVGEKYNPT